MKKGESELSKLKEKAVKIVSSGMPTNKLTVGQRAADWLTKWAGSWGFIVGFFVFLIVWMLVNALFLVRYEAGNPWDPYPFILLNLCLSCLAAVQAPIILMSQNRAAERDRQRAEYDYAVNRKAEREIEQIQDQLKRIEKRLGGKR